MKLLRIIPLCIILISISLSVFAGTEECTTAASSAQQFLRNCGWPTIGIRPDEASDKQGIVKRVKSIAEKAITFGGILAVGALVWAGIQYTTAYGEDEKLKHAKTTGIYAAIGLLLLMAGFGLVDIFLNFIGVIGA